MAKEYEKDLTINKFMDEMVFSMDVDIVDWEKLEEFSDADPSSREYRKMMRDLKITGRDKRKVTRWRDEDDY